MYNKGTKYFWPAGTQSNLTEVNIFRPKVANKRYDFSKHSTKKNNFHRFRDNFIIRIATKQNLIVLEDLYYQIMQKILNILIKRNFHPYKFLPVKNLSDPYKFQRHNNCQQMIRNLQNNKNFINKIIFTD